MRWSFHQTRGLGGHRDKTTLVSDGKERWPNPPTFRVHYVKTVWNSKPWQLYAITISLCMNALLQNILTVSVG